MSNKIDEATMLKHRICSTVTNGVEELAAFLQAKGMPEEFCAAGVLFAAAQICQRTFGSEGAAARLRFIADDIEKSGRVPQPFGNA